MNRFRNRNRIASLVLCLIATLVFITLYVISEPGRRTSDGTGADDGTENRNASPETEARNRVWTLFNNDCLMPEFPAASFEASLCCTLHPETGDEMRLRALLELRSMGGVRFETEDAGRLVGILRDGGADTRIGLMRGMTADSELGMRIADLTCDYERMRLFLWGEEIPLE
jgi:hypothetical protein